MRCASKMQTLKAPSYATMLLSNSTESADLASRVAAAIGVDAPEPDPKFYHHNKTANIGAFGQSLLKLDGLRVGLLASVQNTSSIAQGADLQAKLASAGVDVFVVGERMVDGINQTYSASDAVNFDAVVVANGAEGLFGHHGASNGTSAASALYPAGRPLDILVDAFRFGKPVGALGKGSAALRAAQISFDQDGVYVARTIRDEFVDGIKGGLRTWKFLDRFTLDHEEVRVLLVGADAFYIAKP